jgi:hypothetical protein
MSTRIRKLPRVELLNVPTYRQGTFDSLCVYYTAAMMLSALYPQYDTTRFGAAARQRATKNLSDDPLITNYGREDHRLILARWFYQGEHVRKAAAILNRIMQSDGKSTRFKCLDETAHDNTFRDVIAGSIDDGLPVMLGWNTPDYGNHAVLVTGYWEGREKWFLINDPMGDAHQISWDSLKQQRTQKFEVGLCKPETHSGYRPLKRYEAPRRGAPIVNRWAGGEYKPLESDSS